MEDENSSPTRRIRRLVNNERKFLWSPSGNVTVVGWVPNCVKCQRGLAALQITRSFYRDPRVR